MRTSKEMREHTIIEVVYTICLMDLLTVQKQKLELQKIASHTR